MSVIQSTLQKRIKTMKNISHHHRPSRKSVAMSLALILSITGIMACSDLQSSGITNSDVQQAQTTLHAENRPLFVLQEDKNLDGKPENKEIFQPGTVPNFDPKHIKSFGKITGEEATQKYGQRAENGVVLITLYDKQAALNGTSSASVTVPSTKNTSAFPDTTQKKYFITVDQMPKLKKGMRPIQQCIKYPDEARTSGIQGQVIVRFVVNKQGLVENPEIIHGIGGGADEESVRCVKRLTFEPGVQDGEPVRVQYAMPITFSLHNIDKPKPVSNKTIAQADTANWGPRLVVVGYGEDDPDPNIAVGVADSVDITKPINN